MIKRFVLFAILAGLVAGCQSPQAPVVEPAEEVEPPKQEQVEEQVQEPQEKAPEPEAETAVVEPQKSEEQVQEKQEQQLPERTTVMILMKTSKGDIKIELDKEKAPKTVANFMAYVEADHYNGTIFHRVMDGFMVQGGGFDENMGQKNASNTVENEAKNGLKNVTGSIAMARTSDPHSASAQFFFNINDNTFLDFPGQDGWGYCVFGQVVEGMDVVNEIKGVKTGNSGYHQNVPTEPVFITEVSVIED